MKWLLMENADAFLLERPEAGTAVAAAAAGHGHTAMLELLASHRVRVSEGPIALLDAANCGHLVAVEWLLHYGADVHQQGGEPAQAPLHVAAWHGHRAVVRCLLK